MPPMFYRPRLQPCWRDTSLPASSRRRTIHFLMRDRTALGKLKALKGRIQFAVDEHNVSDAIRIKRLQHRMDAVEAENSEMRTGIKELTFRIFELEQDTYRKALKS